MRLRKVKDVEEKIKDYEGLIIFDLENNKGKWHKLFSNNNPIHIEIGMGKGKFIMQLAKENPNINYIGCELSNSIIYKAAKKIKEENLNNLLLVNCDALKLASIFEKGEIEKIYLNFSDPWPKSRHEKRRLTSKDFINVYKQILNRGSIIEFKTDNRSLFEYSVISMNTENLKFIDISLDLHHSNYEHIVTTEYEDRFNNLGNVIYYIKVEV